MSVQTSLQTEVRLLACICSLLGVIAIGCGEATPDASVSETEVEATTSDEQPTATEEIAELPPQQEVPVVPASFQQVEEPTADIDSAFVTETPGDAIASIITLLQAGEFDAFLTRYRSEIADEDRPAYAAAFTAKPDAVQHLIVDLQAVVNVEPTILGETATFAFPPETTAESDYSAVKLTKTADGWGRLEFVGP